MRDGYRPALYFVIGWGVFLVCCSVVVMNIAFWGLSALGYLVIIGFAAEQEALRGNQHAFNQLKKVFYPHQIDKIKEGRALEETMPTSQRDACAICFDIVRSSRIESDQGRSFIEGSLKACESALTEHYEGVSMVATGYRVKEMGDGFLCTVGYPFRTVDGQDPAIGAMELALNFVRIFQKQVEELASGQEIFCSVGLAFGNVQGHFPTVGVVEYEVDGRAVDLAQRYESFRKAYFPEGPPGHVITVHAAVYEQLPSHLQKNFISVDLREAQIVMRDDPEAMKVYYCLLKPHAVQDPLRSVV
jgi:class 3 adenylate cyclase